MRKVIGHFATLAIMMLGFVATLAYHNEHLDVLPWTLHYNAWLFGSYFVVWVIGWHMKEMYYELTGRYPKLRTHVSKRAFAILVTPFLLTTLVMHPAPVEADVLQCPYPATGFQAVVQPVVGQAIGYICNYPLERGLQHLHAEYGGYTTTGSAGINLGIPGLQGGNAGINFGIGLTLWSQSWRCPDERYIAAPPNGIGAWKDPQSWEGVKCPAVSRAPLALNAPWPPNDPNIVVVVNQILPPGEPDPTAAPVDGPPPAEAPVNPNEKGATAAITDPVKPGIVQLTPNGQ